MNIFSTPAQRRREALARGDAVPSASSSSSSSEDRSSAPHIPLVVNKTSFPVVSKKTLRENPAYEAHFLLAVKKRNPFAFLHKMGGEQYHEIARNRGKEFYRTLRKEQKAKRIEKSKKRQPTRSFDVMENSPGRMRFFSTFAELFPVHELNDDTFRGYLSYNHREGRYEPSSVETPLSSHSVFLEDEEYSVIVQNFNGVPHYRQVVGNYREGRFRTSEDLRLTDDEEVNEKLRLRLEARNNSNLHCYVFSYHSSTCGDSHPTFDTLVEAGEEWSAYTLHRLTVKKTYLGKKIPVSAERDQEGNKIAPMESHAEFLRRARTETIAKGKYYPYIGQLVERAIYVNKVLVASFGNSAKGLRYFNSTSAKTNEQGDSYFQSTTLFFGLDMVSSVTALASSEKPLISGFFVSNKRTNLALRRRRISDNIIRRNPDIDAFELRKQTDAILALGPKDRPNLFRSRYCAGVARKSNAITTEAVYGRPGKDHDLSYKLTTSEDGMSQMGARRRNGILVSFVVQTLGEEQKVDRVVTTTISNQNTNGMHVAYGNGRKKIVRVVDRNGYTKTTYIHSKNRACARSDDIDRREKRTYSNGVVTWEKNGEIYSYTGNTNIPLVKIDSVKFWPENYAAFTRRYVNCLFLGSLPREIEQRYGLRENGSAVHLQMWQCLEKHNPSIYRSLSSSHDLSLILESPNIFRKHNTGDIVYKNTNKTFSNGERVTSYPIRAIIFNGRSAKLASELPPEIQETAFVPHPLSIEGIREYFSV
jgi:hypothetical protein